MSTLDIILYPNPILRQISQSVDPLNDDIQKFIDDLVDTLYNNPSIGLAAPQVGRLVRIIAVDAGAMKRKTRHRPPSEEGRLIVMVNPVIVEHSGKKIVREGCLSIPDFTGNVKRAERVTVTGLNRQGHPMTIHSDGMEAVALQHEIDHLDGILFVHRVASLKHDIFRRKRYA